MRCSSMGAGAIPTYKSAKYSSKESSITKLYKQYFKQSRPIKQNKNSNTIKQEEKENIIVNQTMATQTMYNLMMKQNKYYVALQILNNMKNIGIYTS